MAKEKSLFKPKRTCSLCGKDKNGVSALVTITPLLWRKPKDSDLPRNKCLRAGKGIVLCDDCFALAVLANAEDARSRELWASLKERLISSYNAFLQEVK